MKDSANAVRKMAHFSVQGDDLTRMVRDFVLSELPDKAERLLVAAFPDFPMRYAHGICAGTMKLVGNESDMTVEPDRGDGETAGYLKTLGYIYAGRVRVGRMWWRPRAWVSDIGSRDGRHAIKLMGDDVKDVSRDVEQALADGRDLWSVTPGVGGNRVMRQLYEARLSFYARAGERVFPIGRAPVNRRDGTEARPGWAIFEPVEAPPSWWPELAGPEAALVQFTAAGRRLDVESHAARYADEPKAVRRKLPFRREPLEDPKVREARLAAADEKRERDFIMECARIGAEVRKRAGNDTFLLETEDGRSWSVPRAPFENWALGRTVLRHMAPPWEPVATSGMKLPFDNEWHTDWMLGSGIGISHESYYDEAIRDAAYHEQSKIQDRLAGWKATVVVDAGEVYGVVGKDILVLPDMRPEHVEAMLKARAVIAEVGGAAVHLAQVGAEHNKTIMIVPDATTRYRKGVALTLVPAEGRIDCFVHQKIKNEDADE
jgi:phosphohistidine swiveling domain-containing protein